jgi:hypothetical protein
MLGQLSIINRLIKFWKTDQRPRFHCPQFGDSGGLIDDQDLIAL